MRKFTREQFSVGQRLFLLKSNRFGRSSQPPARELSDITKIREPYLYLNNGMRLEIETLKDRRDSRTHNIQAYLSEDDYLTEITGNYTWSRLREAVRNTYQAPENMTIDLARQLNNILDTLEEKK